MKNETPRMVSSGALVVKIMSDEDAPDNDPRKCFQILANVESAIFKREKDKAFISVLFMSGDQEDFDVAGNCYLMNEAGETVAKFGAARIPPSRLAA